MWSALCRRRRGQRRRHAARPGGSSGGIVGGSASRGSWGRGRVESPRPRRSRRCACARARRPAMSAVATPIGLPYLMTAPPARIGSTATLWPRGIARDGDDARAAELDRGPASSASSAVATLSRSLMTSAGSLVDPAREKPAVHGEQLPGHEAAASEARKTAAPTSSSSLPKRFIGVRIRNSWPRGQSSSAAFRSVLKTPGRDRVDRDAVRRPLHRERARQPGDRRLRRGVGATSNSPTNDDSDAMPISRPLCRAIMSRPNALQVRSVP